MRRIVLLTTLAAMLAAAMALSGVAQAAKGGNKANAQCRAEAVRTLQPGFKPSDYAFHGGTEDDDDFRFQGTADVPDVFCGFGGVDGTSTLEAVDIFLGGDGDDRVEFNIATFNGDAGDDVSNNNSGTFNGGDGTDTVDANFGGCVINAELGDLGSSVC